MQFFTLSQTSLAKSGSSAVEEYIPLWMADGTYAGNNGTNTLGVAFLSNGSSSFGTLTPSSPITLHTLNSNWNSSQKFALEITMYSSAATSISAELWDITSNVAVTGSAISTTSTTATVLRTGQFTLIPGHSYGVTCSQAGSNLSYVTDASLIVFGQ